MTKGPSARERSYARNRRAACLAGLAASKTSEYGAGGRAVIARWCYGCNPAGEPVDAELVDEHTSATISFITGVMIGFATGTSTIASARQLDRMPAGIVLGLASADGREGDRTSGRYEAGVVGPKR